MTETYTSLQEIVKNSIEYRKELYEFLGLTLNYELVDSTQTNGNALNNIKWLETSLKQINLNLKKESISISISKNINEFSNNINNSDYLPIVKIKHPTLNIDFISTTFFNKIIVYNINNDLLQILPVLKLYKPLSENESETIISIFQIVASELTQYTYFNKE